MFDPEKNDGYYQLGLEAAALIRRIVADEGAPSQSTVVGSETENPIDPNKGSSQEVDMNTNEGADLLL